MLCVSFACFLFYHLVLLGESSVFFCQAMGDLLPSSALFHFMNLTYYLTHSLDNRHLDCFQFETIIINVLKNIIVVYMGVHTCIYVEYIP